MPQNEQESNMKTSDINVGEDYAYRSHSWATPKRVTVLATGIEQRASNYSGTVRKVGVRVRFAGDDNIEAIVTARQIDRTWEDWESHQKAKEESRQRSIAEENERRADRAGFAKRLDDVLASHGVGRHREYVSRTERETLKAVGFEQTEDGFFLTRMTGLDDLMRHGRVSMKDAGMLL